MYLRRIEVQGFKSFPRRTVLDFDIGLTALVGPNGAGKSNIADAIRWALGEQNARALRTQRTEDIIFNGTPTRSRAGMAEVNLVFDNQEGWLPLEYSEVNVTRRAYRSGENVYLINDNSVRLRDLQDLLRTGAMGVNGQIVVGQGQIDAILRLKPEDRRAMLEEAAGVSRHYAKRDEAQRKLAKTERNLDRLRDLHVELGPRLEDLAMQADVAQRSSEIVEELKAHTRVLLTHRLWQAETSLESAQAAAHSASDHLAEFESTDLKSKDNSTGEALESARLRHQQVQASLDDCRAQVANISADSRLEKQKAEFENSKIAELVVRKEELTTLIATTQSAVELERTSLEASVSTANELELEIERAGGEPITATDLQELQERAVSARRQATILASEIARIQESEKSFAVREKEAKGEVDKSRSELSKIHDTIRSLEEEFGLSGKELETAQQSESQARDARITAARTVEIARAVVETTASEVMRCKAEIAGAKAELEALHAANNTVSPKGPVISSLLAEADSLHLIGLLRSGIEHVPNEVTNAFEAAVGHLLDDVVISNSAHIAALLKFLADKDASTIRIRPAEGFQVRKRRMWLGGGPPTGPGILGTLDAIVSISTNFQQALVPLLKAIIVVDTLSTAIDLRSSRSDAADYHIVDLAGDLIDRDGSVIAGAIDRGSPSDLGRRTRHTSDRLSEIEQSLAGLMHDEAEARENLGEALSAEELSLTGLEAAQQAASQAKAQLRKTEEEIALATRQMSWWQDVGNRSDQTLREIVSRITNAQNRLTELQPSIEPAKRAVEVSDHVLSQANVAPFANSAAQLDLERQRISNQTEALKRKESEIAGQQATLETTKVDLQTAQKETEANRTEANRLDQVVTELRRTQLEHEGIVQRLRKEQLKLEFDRERTILEASSRESELTRLRDLVRASDERVEAADQRISELQERVQEELNENDLKPSRFTGSIKETVVEIERLRYLVRGIGLVNPLAPQQYEEECRRANDLGIQIDDMEASAVELMKLSQELEMAVRNEFMEIFDAIRCSFQKHFEHLVGDGKALMRLTDEDQLKASGIEIEVQMPGKRRQPLNALSGGERAMVGTALLFAMIEARGGPLCVLDEVDAALDETNVQRFQDVLANFSRRMQVIMITHNTDSIERAGSIFGIAMASDGISQVVSLRLDGVAQSDAALSGQLARQN